MCSSWVPSCTVCKNCPQGGKSVIFADVITHSVPETYPSEWEASAIIHVGTVYSTLIPSNVQYCALIFNG